MEVSNINLPKLITEVVKQDVLSLGLDRLRKRQRVPLKLLKDFTDSSKEALQDIEEEMSTHFKEFVKSL